MKRATLLLIVVGIVAYNWWVRHGLAQPSVVLIPAAPLQRDIGAGEPFFYKRYTITPLASFSMEGMVLGRETYKSGRESELSPVDLVLGWGLLSDLSVLDKLTVVQSNRRGYLSTTSSIPIQTLVENNSNMHMIPANAAVAENLEQVRRGQIARLRGKLVKVQANDGWSWTSSLNRTDTGDGACEIVWVEDFTFAEPGKTRSTLVKNQK